MEGLQNPHLMIALIVSSKTLDFEVSIEHVKQWTHPLFIKDAETLVKHLRRLDSRQLADLMKLSPALTELTHRRYREFPLPFTPDTSRQALYAFKGDVYQGLDTDAYDTDDISFAQAQVRILSGLYGVLRPLDLIHPYRLEMATRLAGPWGKNLYDFWNDRLAEALKKDLAASPGDPVFLNLASGEYIRAVKDLKTVTVDFKERTDTGYRAVAIHAKRARGIMTDTLIKERISSVEQLKTVSFSGYAYQEDLSDTFRLVFTRG